MFLGPRAPHRAVTRGAVTQLVARAARRCGLGTIYAHRLRHTTAMRLLAAGVDSTVIALWLGHESVATTQIYIHADLALKERALARTAPMDAAPGRYRPSDTVMAFLDSL